MTLEEAIKHCDEVIKNETSRGCFACSDEHKQLRDWLQELKQYRIHSKNTASDFDDATEEWMAGQGTKSNNMEKKKETINESKTPIVNIFDSMRKCKECDYVLSIAKAKQYVKIDRKVLFEICDAILEHDGYSDHNDCPENDSECFHGDWDTKFRKKVENIRNNS